MKNIHYVSFPNKNISITQNYPLFSRQQHIKVISIIDNTAVLDTTEKVEIKLDNPMDFIRFKMFFNLKGSGNSKVVLNLRMVWQKK